MLKKLMVYFLVLGFLIQPFFPVMVSAKSTYSLGSPEDESVTGNLEVDLKFELPMKNTKDSNIEVLLWKETEVATVDLNGIATMEEKEYSLGNHKGTVSIKKTDKYGKVIPGASDDDIYYYALTFHDLVLGNYQVQLKGKGYTTTVIDNVSLFDYSKRISITNLKGGFTVGNVNGDAVVDENDLKAMSNFLLQNSSYDVNYDLNRDGMINTSDLSMITHALYGTSKAYEVVDTSAILTKESFSLGESSSSIVGNVEDLITGLGTVQIKPSEGSEEISEQHPAILSLKMNSEIQMSEIRLDVLDENVPQKLLLEIEDSNGEIHTESKSFELQSGDVHYFTDEATDHTIVIDLGKQIAVKKVTIKILKTTSSTLADISKVEFLNNVYEKVPEPVMEAPHITVTSESEKATVSWATLANVTGYEVTLNRIINGTPSLEVKLQTVFNEMVLEELKNYEQYSVTVQAINGEWRSTPSNEVSFIPTPSRIPPAVENVSVSAQSSGLDIVWGKMKDTQVYQLYYRKKGDETFQKIENISETRYSLRNLEVNTEYELYVTGVNELGEGPKSVTVIGITKANTFPDVSPYRLINRSLGGEVTEHIKDVSYGINSNTASKYALVDHNLNTYWTANTWDIGGFNVGHSGPKITFDQKYKMNYIDLIPFDDQSKIFYAKIWYRDGDGYLKETNTRVTTLTAPNGEKYHRIYFDKVTTDLLEINLANYLAGYIGITVRDIQFYEYDSLEDDLNHLFKDSLHVELEDFVTEAHINELYRRTEQIDDRNQVYHPSKEIIQKELDYARSLLQDKDVKDVISVDTSLTYNKDTHLGYAYQTSDLQPLGVAVKGGDKIVVYIGSSNPDYMPQIVFTQYHAEWNSWSKVIEKKDLVIGRNEITVPDLINSDLEHGGSVYVKFPYSNASNVEVKVRVSGGEKIPVLDISKEKDENTRKTLIENYITELTSYVNRLKENRNASLTSVYNSTEIVTQDGLFSVAATAVYDELVKSDASFENQVTKLADSLTAFDEMMEFFYRQKGLEENPEDARDRRPVSRINIRYMTMFDGAFMYAGGGHVGIEYGSIGGLVSAKPASKTGDGVDTFGYFGWGISHEIGHQINHSSLVHAEVTNNVYALLAQTADDQDASRLEESYDKIYKKVTSGSKGKGSNVFVTLGMYWQLHLAYDDNKTFSDTDSIYARINHLARTTTLKSQSKDDLLVMLASEAAGKNLVPFFEAWGLTPSEEAISYASQFDPETREIRYLNDGARRYRLAHGRKMSDSTVVSAKITNKDHASRSFTLEFSVPDSEKEAILGYEIKRNGVVVGFTTDQYFTDLLGSVNNRALTYEITAYDKYLNKTSPTVLEEVKISHDGTVLKEAFGISSNYQESDEDYDFEDLEMDYSKLGVNKLIDGSADTVFDGTKKIEVHSIQGNTSVLDPAYQGDPYVIVDLNSSVNVTGFKYTAGGTNAIKDYKIYVSNDREHWDLVKKGTFADGVNTVYFDTYDDYENAGGNSIWTYYDVSYIKVEAVGASGISGSELDVISPPGDNVELTEVGILKDDFRYSEESEEHVIPAGSVIFKGSYRGHPAFNVGLIADADKNFEIDSNFSTGVYEGSFIPFAQLNHEGTVYEVLEGTWLYIMTPEEYEAVEGKDVRANLFRVNVAETNEDARLTSTSYKKENLPQYEDLPTIELKTAEAGGLE